MRILLIGSGGREHAIAKKLKSEGHEIWALPGNDGMRDCAHLLAENSWKDFEQVKKICTESRIEMAVIGPEEPLVLGLSDFLRDEKVPVFGVGKKAAQLEGSKAFAKEFMETHQIPTAKWKRFSELSAVAEFLNSASAPFVVKADGLAAGKGVVICEDRTAALQAAKEMLVDQKFGTAGKTLIIEEFLEGFEASLHFFTDGRSAQNFPLAMDHKKLCDGNLGPNTGGMGTVAPINLSLDLQKQINELVVQKILQGFQTDQLDFVGVLFVGLMIHPTRGPFVLEFNCRFGDPETQVLLPLMKSPFGEALFSVAQGRLPTLVWEKEKAAACVIAAAEGYPEKAKQGAKIQGLESTWSASEYPIIAGAALGTEGWTATGGRVLGAVGVGANLQEALKAAYRVQDQIQFYGKQVRRDIGQWAISKGHS